MDWASASHGAIIDPEAELINHSHSHWRQRVMDSPRRESSPADSDTPLHDQQPANGHSLAGPACLPEHPSRRRMLKTLAGLGAGTAVFHRSLVALAEDASTVTDAMIQQAEWVSGVSFTQVERDLMLEGLNESVGDYEKIRSVPLDNSVSPAFSFRPMRSQTASNSAQSGAPRGSASMTETASGDRPASDEDLAFLPLTELAAMIRTRKISSLELTRLYLDRLKRYDPALHCVITLMEEAALRQANRADREISAGRYRGPLHGIPWGAKDLLAHGGYRTTWGAKPYKDQVRSETATVINRLQEAGAVLVAKLSVGALAWGDVWFDGKTRNPWNPEQGSSGSSAGPASATAAGLVGFTLGTETWGSIVSPCTRCGATGLRPTFGRVSRFGCMALAWTMDKIGPIARSVEDCALVFDAIRGQDGLDTSATDGPFAWPPSADPRTMRVGFVESLFDNGQLEKIEDEKARQRAAETLAFDRRTLDQLRRIGFQLIPIELPKKYPINPLSLILTAEASAAFDELTRSGLDDQLVRQEANAWPNVLRQGQLIPAVEYIRANRIRTLLLQDMERLMAGVDVYVAPSFGGDNLLLTNLTGHPAVVLPNGFRADGGTPTSITFTGKLDGESQLLAVAHAYQQASGHHLRRPSLTV